MIPHDRLLTLAVGKTDGKSNSLRLTLTDICSSIPNPASIATDIGREFHVRHD